MAQATGHLFLLSEVRMLATELLDETLVLCPNVAATVIEDGAVLLDLETKYFDRLNSTGWAIVQMLENGASAREIEAQCIAWGALPHDAADGVVLVEKMLAEALVAPGSPAPHPMLQFHGPWVKPTIERQAEPLHRLVSSAFDPSIPLAE
jgi:hypothetical protein